MSIDFLRRSFTARLLLLAVLLTFGAILVFNEGFAAYILGTILLGAMYAHAVELQHQCLHYTAFKTRRLNRIVGIALGLPTLTSFQAYRRSHLAHHKNLGTPHDATFFVYRFVESPTLFNLAYDLLGISHLTASLSAILGNSDSRLIDIAVPSNCECRDCERFDYGLMGFLMVLAILFAMTFGILPVLKIWVVPFLFVTQPIHFLIELPEHLGCNTTTQDVFQNTRSITGSPFSSWFTNYNNLHVEHHQDAVIPMADLPYLYQSNRGKHGFHEINYFQFYKVTLHTVWSKRLLNSTAPKRSTT